MDALHELVKAFFKDETSLFQNSMGLVSVDNTERQLGIELKHNHTVETAVRYQIDSDTLIVCGMYDRNDREYSRAALFAALYDEINRRVDGLEFTYHSAEARPLSGYVIESSKDIVAVTGFVVDIDRKLYNANNSSEKMIMPDNASLILKPFSFMAANQVMCVTYQYGIDGNGRYQPLAMPRNSGVTARKLHTGVVMPTTQIDWAVLL